MSMRATRWLSLSFAAVIAVAAPAALAQTEAEPAPAEEAAPVDPAEAARAFAKEGKHAEAARAWLQAADAASAAAAPSLRHRAALAFQRAADFGSAREQYMVVAGDRAAPVALRVDADARQNLVFWFEEFAAIQAATVGEIGSFQGSAAELARRAKAYGEAASAAATRLKKTSKQLVTSRKKLAEIMGPDDPMVGELDALLDAYAEQAPIAKEVAAGAGQVKKLAKTLGSVVGGLGKSAGGLAKKIDAAKAVLTGKADAKLKVLHKAVIVSAGRAAGETMAATLGIAAHTDELSASLDRLEPKLEGLVQVIGVGELLLGSASE